MGLLRAAPQWWSRERVFIIGGGPSVKDLDPDRLLFQGKVIGINEAFLSMSANCHIGFFGDARWFDWNRERIIEHANIHALPNFILTTAPLTDADLRGLPVIYNLQKAWDVPLSDDPTRLVGRCSGSQAINLAYLCGARDIVLIGFDAHDLPTDRWQEGYWHDRHKLPPNPGQRASVQIPCFERMAEALAEKGVMVTNATPGSALKCFPYQPLEEILDADVSF
ncbi:hypothetical protein WKW50_16450 [Ochrobactrum sp. GPK 3]